MFLPKDFINYFCWGLTLFQICFSTPLSTVGRKHQLGFQTENFNVQGQNNASFLWRIDSSPPSYLFGTIHVPYSRVWAFIPDNAKQAFRSSAKVFFELNIADHKTLLLLSACQLLPSGQHISQLLPSDLYLRLKLHMEHVKDEMDSWLTNDQRRKGIDADYLYSTMTANWERKKPIWVALMVNSLTRKDIASRGEPVLDLFLTKLAMKHGKKLGAIETAEDQCEPFNNLELSHVIFALNQSLVAQENHRYGIKHPSSEADVDDFVTQYKNGNFDSNLFNQDTFSFTRSIKFENKELSEDQRRLRDEINKYMYKNLIESRNKKMAAKIVDLLVNKPDSYFFAFGAGHFVGEHNILDLIRAAGFRVDHVGPNDDLRQGFDNRRPQLRNRIKGTFDDLPAEEKTKALLQFLQYRQRLEREESNRQMANDGIEMQQEEEKIEKSIEVWTGLDSFSSSASSTLRLTQVVKAFAFAVLIRCTNFT